MTRRIGQTRYPPECAAVRTVVAPDGRTWKVGRQWLPWRLRLRRERDDAPLFLDPMGLAEFGAGGIVLGLVVVVLVILLLFVLLPVVVLALEIVLAVLVLLVVVTGRVVFRRPWRVMARAEDEFRARHAWQVVGWRPSERVIDEVAEALAAGRTPATPEGAERVAVAVVVGR